MDKQWVSTKIGIACIYQGFLSTVIGLKMLYNCFTNALKSGNYGNFKAFCLSPCISSGAKSGCYGNF
jgi:hypothetical protein